MTTVSFSDFAEVLNENTKAIRSDIDGLRTDITQLRLEAALALEKHEKAEMTELERQGEQLAGLNTKVNLATGALAGIVFLANYGNFIGEVLLKLRGNA